MDTLLESLNMSHFGLSAFSTAATWGVVTGLAGVGGIGDLLLCLESLVRVLSGCGVVPRGKVERGLEIFACDPSSALELEKCFGVDDNPDASFFCDPVLESMSVSLLVDGKAIDSYKVEIALHTACISRHPFPEPAISLRYHLSFVSSLRSLQQSVG